MSNILISGPLGHIGSFLVRSLPEHNLTLVDNLLTQRYCSLIHLPKNCTFVEKDFSTLDLNFINQFDTIIHLAAITDAAGSIANEKQTMLVNYEQVKTFVDLINQSTVKSIIFTSTTSVYGESDSIKTENSYDLNPQSPYAKSKLLAEEYIINSGVPYIIFRFGTIFGTYLSPGCRFHTAVNKFCYQACFNQPITVWKSHIDLYRPYLGLNDAIEAIRFALEDKLQLNEIYNVITSNYKLSYILDTIKNNIDFNVKYVDSPILNQTSYMISDEKIKFYGFSPEDNIELEIAKTIKGFKS